MTRGEVICPLADVDPDGSLCVRVRELNGGPAADGGRVGDGAGTEGECTGEGACAEGDGTVVEAIVLRNGDGAVAYRNYCQHFTDVALDKGGGAVRRNGAIVCANHGAFFAVDSGECTHGPCEGAVLERVEIAVADGTVRLVDEGYEFVGLGPVPTDPVDRSPAGGVGF